MIHWDHSKFKNKFNCLKRIEFNDENIRVR